MDYSELVKALRYCDKYALCNDCPIFETCDGDVDKAMAIAADAIEALQAEEKSRKENCEKCSDATRRVITDLQKIIADLRAQLPKRGKWIRVQEVDIPGEMHPVAFKCMCSICRNEYLFPRIPRYCPDCGSMNTAKMEVQE